MLVMVGGSRYNFLFEESEIPSIMFSKVMSCSYMGIGYVDAFPIVNIGLSHPKSVLLHITFWLSMLDLN